MTSFENQSGPGYSPGADDEEVTVRRPEAGAGAPIQDGAQELRDDAAAARAEGADSRADNPRAQGTAAEHARQTEKLDPDRGGEAARSGG